MDLEVYASRPLSWGCGGDPLGAAWGERGLWVGVPQLWYSVRTGSFVAYSLFLSEEEKWLE